MNGMEVKKLEIYRTNPFGLNLALVFRRYHPLASTELFKKNGLYIQSLSCMNFKIHHFKEGNFR